MAQPQNKKNDSPDWYDRNIKFRGLVTDEKLKSSFIQIIGFILIGLGVFYLSAFLFIDRDPSNDDIAITFFIIMLGVAFAFPELLKGGDKEEGMSTMRIVVFMMTNVICLLLLKMGWKPEITSLKEIGLDQYWVGFIAFVFGAKATQYYFENMVKREEAPKTPVVTQTLEQQKAEIPSKSEIAKLAVQQHREALMAQHRNIVSVSDTYDGKGNYRVTIYLKDNDMDVIPKKLIVNLDKSQTTVETEIITGTGIAKPHGAKKEIEADEISDSQSPGYKGSISCVVESNATGRKGLVTSGHIFTHGEYINYGGRVKLKDRRDILINGKPEAKLYLQLMNEDQDLGIAEISEDTLKGLNYLSFKKGFYAVTNDDVMTNQPNVNIVSRKNGDRPIKRQAYILDHSLEYPIIYEGGITKVLKNVILIGNSNNRSTSKPVSEGGDSGSPVFNNENQLIGMLLGGDERFTFVLPLENTLIDFNFKIL